MIWSGGPESLLSLFLIICIKLHLKLYQYNKHIHNYRKIVFEKMGKL